MLKTFLVLALAVTVLGGCAAAKQVYRDYQMGRKAPLSDGERSPKDVARVYAELVGAINPAAGKGVLGVLTVFLTFRRGRRLRKQLPTSDTPFTGFFGNLTGFEKVVQYLADVRSGLFDVGARNSAKKRGWKMAVLLGVAALGTPLITAIPFVKDLLVSHGSLTGGIGVTLAVLAASIEKTVSKVLPLAPKPAQ